MAKKVNKVIKQGRNLDLCQIVSKRMPIAIKVNTVNFKIDEG